ncbi:hypothetical protein CR956_01810 [Candidatus Saccharibacteria bacterium]|nr:MAG: hypothetical protein CR956_01810 [Candidatus Saccharibacteria bacterium]
MTTTDKTKGFTIVELTLAILFVSILLLAFAVVTIRIGHMYEKGITIKTINQIGRETMDSLRRDVRRSESFLELKNSDSDNGNFRLCLKNVVYLGNYGKMLNSDSPGIDATRFKIDGKPARLVRIEGNDVRDKYCADVPKYDITADKRSELLVSDNTELAVHKLAVSPAVTHGISKLYKLDIEVGTNKKGSLDNNTRCRINHDDSLGAKPDFDYCSVVEFTTFVRIGGVE